MGLDAILIDDDILVRLAWTESAKRAQKKIRVFCGYEDFLAEVASLDRSTCVYVDVQLAGSVGGDEIAGSIHQLGFKSVYLATGHFPQNVSAFEGLKFLAGIVGKTPPW